MGVARFPRPSAFHTGATAILAAALAVRLIGLDKSIGLDEATTLRICGADSVRAWIIAWLGDSQPPLYPILLTIWSRVSLSVPFLRLLSVALGVAAVWVAMTWLRRTSERAAIAAGLLFACAPVLIHYSQELRPYSLLVLVTMLSFHAASRVVEQPARWRRCAALAACLVAVVFTHFIGTVLVPAVAVFLVLAAPDRRRLVSPGPILALALPLAAGVALRVAQEPYLSRFTTGWWMPPLSPGLLWRIVRGVGGLPLATEETASRIVMAAPLVTGAVALGLAVASTRRSTWRMGLPLLAAALAYWTTLMVYSAAVMPVAWRHTALPGLVPLLAFIAAQAGTGRPARRRMAAMLAIVLAGGTGAAAWVSTEAGRPDEAWQQAAIDAESRWQAGDAAVFWPDYAERPLRFYFRGLPDDVMAAIRPGDESAATRARLEAVLESSAVHQETSRLLLVTRADMVTRRHAAAFDRLVAAIAARANRFSQIEVISITADAPLVPELQALAGRMFATMDAAFGPPASADRRAGYERRTYTLDYLRPRRLSSGSTLGSRPRNRL